MALIWLTCVFPAAGGSARAQAPTSPRPANGERVRIWVSPSGRIETRPQFGLPLPATRQLPGATVPVKRPAPTPVSAGAGVASPAPVNAPSGSQLSRSGAPVAVPAGQPPRTTAVLPPPTTIPTREPNNPFAHVRLHGPVPPALGEKLRKATPTAPTAPTEATVPPAPLPAAPATGAVAGQPARPAPPLPELPGPSKPPLFDPNATATRPFFVEGELESFVMRPLSRRNFIGVGAGVASIPNDADALLNTFYITIEPQIDIINERFNWKLGLGAPLNLRLLDTRGSFEQCLDRARAVRGMGGTQQAVSAETASCLLQTRDNITEGIGSLREQDWDEPSDYAKIIRYFTVGKPEGEFYLNISRLFDQSLSHGTVVRDYNANINFNTSRLGATLDFNRAAIGIQGIANDLVRPDVLGLMLFLRPFRPFAKSVFLRSLSLGLSYAHGVNQPKRLAFEPGLFSPAFDEPVPKVDAQLNMVGAQYAPMNVMGIDLEAKLLRLAESDLKVYVDFQKMQEFGTGITLGTLFRHSQGQPATQALRARAELNYFTADFLPSYFDTYHDIFQYQYMPATYQASNGLWYSPSKWQYLEAARGGQPRLGGYVEVAHSLLDRLTLSLAARVWRPVGSAANSGYDGLQFPDYGQACTDKGQGDLDCGAKKIRVADQGFSSLRLRAELPFRKYLQAFASYEVFSSGDENGLGIFDFTGDNEVLFGGARLMLLPFLFLQAETRRYFFLQRVTNIDLQTGSVEQDQRYHANWTFAFTTYVGYEF